MLWLVHALTAARYCATQYRLNPVQGLFLQIPCTAEDAADKKEAHFEKAEQETLNKLKRERFVCKWRPQTRFDQLRRRGQNGSY